MLIKTRRSLPGDLSHDALIDRIIRVDHAGEYGAKRIYAGQLAVLKNSPSAPVIQHMADQEEPHFNYFEKAMVARKVRPTALHPIWHVAGFALGAGTALLGEKAAMACTVAVESVIDEHYQKQEAELAGTDEKDLLTHIQQFRAEEQEHHNTGLEHGAEEAPAYELLSEVIKAGTRAAIWLSERV
jgi:ubiquinone biosynthesis monooxygenase Coq7